MLGQPSANDFGTIIAGLNPIADTQALQTDTAGNLLVRTSDESVLGDGVTSMRYNQLEINFSTAFDANLITNTHVTTGSATQGSGCATYATGAGAAGEATGVSVQTLLYRPGHEWYSEFTASFTAGAASSYQRIGPYSTTDGFYLSYEGTTVNITNRQNSSDSNRIAQSSWNGDPCNGATGSTFTKAGVPVALNFQKLNIFRFRGAWFGAAPVLLQVLSPDGNWVTLHTFRNPNTLTTPYTYTTNWNMTVDVANTGNTSNLAIVTGCWAMGTCDQTIKITDTVTDYSLAPLTRSVLVGKYVTGDAYENVQVDSGGSLFVDVGGVAGSSVSIAAPGIQKVGIVGGTGTIVDAATGAAVPTHGLLVGGSDGTDFRNLSTDTNGRVNVNTSPSAPTTSVYSQAAISTASNPAVLVSGSGTTTIRVYRILLVNAGTTTNITIEDSTPTAFSGAIPLDPHGEIDADGNGDPLWVTAAGKAFQLINSASQSLVGTIWYTQS
jgi:hypothetical protein